MNVTLLFSAEQYQAAAQAYMRGLERIQAGLNPAMASVASLFVSRWDTAVADRVPAELRDRPGIAVAGQAYRAYRELLDSPRWWRLANEGARAQRLLWASTSVKDREAIVDSGQEVDDAAFDRLARRMSYLHGDVTDAALYRTLARKVDRSWRPVYYLEVPPSLFAPIVEQLGAAKLLRDGRVAVEKPFGHDLVSARELNARLHRVLCESQILRLDHFLGKEPVIELEYLRFANFALAELWDRKSVSCVQITMAEDFGIEGRGSLLRPRRRAARRGPEPPDAGARAGRDGPAGRG